MAALSSFFSYAVKRLRWLDENPCSNLLKLKAAPGRDRVLTLEETTALLSACRASRSPYLYCIPCSSQSQRELDEEKSLALIGSTSTSTTTSPSSSRRRTDALEVSLLPMQSSPSCKDCTPFVIRTSLSSLLARLPLDASMLRSHGCKRSDKQTSPIFAFTMCAIPSRPRRCTRRFQS